MRAFVVSCLMVFLVACGGTQPQPTPAVPLEPAPTSPASSAVEPPVTYEEILSLENPA